MTTDHDYSSMVDPFVRAEQEAEARGYWRGIRQALYAIGVGLVLGAILAGLQ